MLIPKNKVEFPRRRDFLSLLPKKSVCAEFGVFTGKFSKHILYHTDPKKLYLVDPYWKRYGDEFFWKPRQGSTWEVFTTAITTVKDVENKDCVSFVIDDDLSFLENIKDDTFDWVYLDSSHDYEDTLKELESVCTKVKEDGLICGHDYYENRRHRHHGVCKAINEWIDARDDYGLFLLDTRSQWMISKKGVDCRINKEILERVLITNSK